jgi:hypothetical protein
VVPANPPDRKVEKKRHDADANEGDLNRRRDLGQRTAEEVSSGHPGAGPY